MLMLEFLSVMIPFVLNTSPLSKSQRRLKILIQLLAKLSPSGFGITCLFQGVNQLIRLVLI